MRSFLVLYKSSRAFFLLMLSGLLIAFSFFLLLKFEMDWGSWNENDIDQKLDFSGVNTLSWGQFSWVHFPRFDEAKFQITPEMKKAKFRIPILMFHYIKDIPSNTDDQLWYKLSYAPQKLEALFEYLDKNKIKTLTFWDVKAILEGKMLLPERAVILTFDDGHREHYTTVLPLLKKYNLKAVFFIISGKADTDPLFVTWDEIRKIAEQGSEIWSHSVNHYAISTLSLSGVRHEVIDSKKQLEAGLGLPIISFCYPMGRYDARVLREVEKEYLFARSTKWGDLFRFAKRFEIPTIRVFPTTKIGELAKYWGL